VVNIRELIIKCTSENLQIVAFFHHYTQLFNKYYEQRENKAYFETIAQGFLYILPDLQTYNNIAESIPNNEIIQAMLKSHKKERSEVALDIIKKFKIASEGPIFLKMEIRPYPAMEVLPSMNKIYTSIHPGIEFIHINENNFTVKFPDINAFIDYNTVFLLSISPKKKKVKDSTSDMSSN
jgi:hypothetical protein